MYKIYIEDALSYSATPGLVLDTTQYMLQLIRAYDKKLAKQLAKQIQKDRVKTKEETVNEVVVAAPRFKRFLMVYTNEKGEEVIGVPGNGLDDSGNNTYSFGRYF